MNINRTRTITVNGRDYIVNPPEAGRVFASPGQFAVYYTYWSTRRGAAFGPIRTTNSTVTSIFGHKIVAAAQQAFGVDHDQLIAEFIAAREA